MEGDEIREELTRGRGKISETFLEFARPDLPEDLGEASHETVDNVLRGYNQKLCMGK